MFENYLIGLKKYKPDYFIYENNKSMSPAIREQITKELGTEPILINSALLSAQNRQRLYWTNIPTVTQPEDKGIMLNDILETGVCWREKSYTLDAHYYKTAGEYNPTKQHSYSRHMAAEPVSVLNINPSGHGMNGAVMRTDGKSRTLTTNKGEGPKIIEPIRIGTIESAAQNADFDSQQYRVYSPDGKSVTLCGNGGGVGAKTGLYAVPIETEELDDVYYHGDEDTNIFGKIVCKNTSDNSGQPAQGTRIYRTDNKSICLDGDSRKYIITDYNPAYKSKKPLTVYEVRNGQISIKNKQYPIKLKDGFYIIRKLTVKECMRLQTVPDTYVFPVSDSQAYKMLGNGWTVDIIAHILSFIPDITTEMIEVLSMYDGMSCGHIALDKLAANVIRYCATEIDKYAI